MLRTRSRFHKWFYCFMAVWLVLVLCLVQPSCLTAAADYGFLNDRAADIIGSGPLQLPGLVVPEGLTGRGVIVGMADSGLDKGSLTDLHPDLQSETGRIPRVAMLKSYTDRPVPDDPVGHGTHMAATVVGSGKASNGQFKGIAPGASLYFQALLDKEGRIKLPDNLNDLFSPAYAAGVRIHVDGWGEGGDSYGPRSAKIDNFVFQHPDFLPIISAGNNGPAAASLTGEANSKNALVVGSSQVPRPVFSPEALDAGQAAASSSRGPAQGGRIKPDLLAPGSSIVSACSRIITGNYAPNSAYTVQGGSSMAAAVAGGAAVLLEEYLKDQVVIKQPSSALLKALLINGARTPEGGPSSEEGFGILDLADTILSLKEGCFQIADNNKNLNNGETLEYRFQVTDTSRPFKATLAWIDSAASSGSSSILVNNLDLQVVDPNGQILLGNDLHKTGVSDRKNNVEQVMIDDPPAGEYVVRVSAAGLSGVMPPAHLALVYGQTLRCEVVKSVSGKKLSLAGGAILDLSTFDLKGSLNASRLYSAQGSITAGSDVYIGPGTVYIFSRKNQSGGMEILSQSQGDLLVAMNPLAREGGNLLVGEQIRPPGSLVLNGKTVEKTGEIPAGVEVQADINPRLQTVWALTAFGRKMNGYIEQVDLNKQQLKLLHDPTIYPLTAWTAVSSKDSLVDSPACDAPYGSLLSSGLDMLAPGIKISMTVSPLDNEVQQIETERSVVVGNVIRVDIADKQIETDNGKTYEIFTGAPIFEDGRKSTLSAIQPGDKMSGVLLAGSRQLVELQVYSNMIYGRVVYVSSQQGVLYLFDSSNNFQMLTLNNESQVFKNGMQSGFSCISPGEWVRLARDSSSAQIQRADLAENRQEDAIKIFKSYDNHRQVINMKDGSSYIYSPATQMTKGGFKITPDLLCAGDQIKITTLVSPSPWLEFWARGEVQINPDARVPDLETSASILNGVLIVHGVTSADKVELFRSDGSQEVVEVNSDGSFNRVFPLLSGEKNLRYVAVNSKDGGIIGKDIEIQALYSDQANPTFLDIGLDPQRRSIEKLASRGLLTGFGDGSFRPQQSVNRAEFLTMLGQAEGWKLERNDGSMDYFKDSGSIPWWALESVYFARQKNVIVGYPDGSFGSQNPLTRSEMTVILARLLPPLSGDDGRISPPYADWSNAPDWARSSYILLYGRGFLDNFPGQFLQPGKTVSRSEAAGFIDRIVFSDTSKNVHVQQ